MVLVYIPMSPMVVSREGQGSTVPPPLPLQFQPKHFYLFHILRELVLFVQKINSDVYYPKKFITKIMGVINYMENEDRYVETVGRRGTEGQEGVTHQQARLEIQAQLVFLSE